MNPARGSDNPPRHGETEENQGQIVTAWSCASAGAPCEQKVAFPTNSDTRDTLRLHSWLNSAEKLIVPLRAFVTLAPV